jgi:hypothetical protein
MERLARKRTTSRMRSSSPLGGRRPGFVGSTYSDYRRRRASERLAGPIASQRDVPLRGNDGRGRGAVGWATGVGVAGVFGYVELTRFRSEAEIVDRGEYAPLITVFVPGPILRSITLFDIGPSFVYFPGRAANGSAVADMLAFRIGEHGPTLILAPPEQI